MLFKVRLLKKESAGTSTVRKCKQAKRVRRSRGSLFLEAALLLLVAVPTVAVLTYFADAYVTKARLGDSAQVIARAIQDDPGITQSFVNGVADGFNGNLGELEKVVSAATGVTGDGVPAGFNVAKYKECNPDISGLTNDAARNHFARAGRYENRTGVFGNCGVHSDVGARDVRVSITSFPSKPSDSAIADLVPPNGGVSDGLHASGRWHTHGEFYGYKYTNPHSDPSKPYWVTVVAKKPFPHLSLFGLPEVKSSSTVRVVPNPKSVTLFQHCFTDTSDGSSVTVKPGRYNKITDVGFRSNQLSALKIPPGTQVTLYEHQNFSGRSIKLTSNTDFCAAPSLNFNDITSSLVVGTAPSCSLRVVGNSIVASRGKFNLSIQKIGGEADCANSGLFSNGSGSVTIEQDQSVDMNFHVSGSCGTFSIPLSDPRVSTQSGGPANGVWNGSPWIVGIDDGSSGLNGDLDFNDGIYQITASQVACN